MRENLRDELDKYEENSAEEARILDEMDDIDRIIASLDEK
jgi:5'-deoxynucleotidase YfbR-like HD superfamily hydrolase